MVWYFEYLLVGCAVQYVVGKDEKIAQHHRGLGILIWPIVLVFSLLTAIRNVHTQALIKTYEESSEQRIEACIDNVMAKEACINAVMAEGKTFDEYYAYRKIADCLPLQVWKVQTSLMNKA